MQRSRWFGRPKCACAQGHFCVHASVVSALCVCLPSQATGEENLGTGGSLKGRATMQEAASQEWAAAAAAPPAGPALPPLVPPFW